MTDILTRPQITQLQQLRQNLHRFPEISGQEVETAARMAQALAQAGADRIWTGLGGHGVAAQFTGTDVGPTVMFRCELDALPIQEVSAQPYRSQHAGKGHLCGHDGHMAMVLGLAMSLARRPARGRVILLFQPAEETGAGAAAVINDPRWPQIRPDFAFAYHNVPGRPLGEIGLRVGTANCASRGMMIRLRGRTSHAAAPEDGLSPAPVLARLIRQLPELGPGGAMGAQFALSTLTHARLGEPTFGIAPGEGELRVTLRSQTDKRMEALIAAAETTLATALAPYDGLTGEVSWHDVFLATVNDAEAVAIAAGAADQLGMARQDMAAPMRWSEDFGRFGGDGVQSAMLFIGSGEDQPQLHNPDFDFPDALIPAGVSLLSLIADRILGGQGKAPPGTGRPRPDG